jgi:hypothetical protein
MDGLPDPAQAIIIDACELKSQGGSVIYCKGMILLALAEVCERN